MRTGFRATQHTHVQYLLQCHEMLLHAAVRLDRSFAYRCLFTLMLKATAEHAECCPTCTYSCCLQAMGSEVKYQDAIIERNQEHVSNADSQLRNLSNQAVKDHRLNYKRR